MQIRAENGMNRSIHTVGDKHYNKAWHVLHVTNKGY